MKKTVVIRSGGLGDFILTIPFLIGLRRTGAGVFLITKRGYLDLIRDDGLIHHGLDIDSSGTASLFSSPFVPHPSYREIFRGSRVFSFLSDPVGLLQKNLFSLGAEEVVFLDPRPASPPHVIERMFLTSGIPLSSFDRYATCLAPAGNAGRKIWLHPGSGSPSKNLSPSLFLEEVRGLGRSGFSGLVVSFGEADLHLVEPIRAAFSDLPDVEYLVSPTLTDLRGRMVREAAIYLGNDSGVSHLAAACGIPSTVFFVSTDPEVWRPVGPAVSVRDLRCFNV